MISISTHRRFICRGVYSGGGLSGINKTWLLRRECTFADSELLPINRFKLEFGSVVSCRGVTFQLLCIDLEFLRKLREDTSHSITFVDDNATCSAKYKSGIKISDGVGVDDGIFSSEFCSYC